MIDPVIPQLVKTIIQKDYEISLLKWTIEDKDRKLSEFLHEANLLPPDYHHQQGFIRCMFDDECLQWDATQQKATLQKIPNLPKEYTPGKEYWVKRDEAGWHRWWRKTDDVDLIAKRRREGKELP